MEENNKKEELTIYNLYKTLKILLDKIYLQSGKELENICVVYNQKLVEIGNKLQENELTFSMVTELTNTINNKLLKYIREASYALDEYLKIIENKQVQMQSFTGKSLFKRIFHVSNRDEENLQKDIKEKLALEKYDEMVCNLKLFKIEKDIRVAIEEYIEENKFKGKSFINKYKKNVEEQLVKIKYN